MGVNFCLSETNVHFIVIWYLALGYCGTQMLSNCVDYMINSIYRRYSFMDLASISSRRFGSTRIIVYYVILHELFFANLGFKSGFSCLCGLCRSYNVIHVFLLTAKLNCSYTGCDVKGCLSEGNVIHLRVYNDIIQVIGSPYV